MSRFQGIGKALELSLFRHTWYLTPQLVCLSLADEDIDIECRQKVLDRLLSYDCPDDNDFNREVAKLEVEISFDTRLEDLVNKDSYLLFTRLGFSKEEVKKFAGFAKPTIAIRGLEI